MEYEGDKSKKGFRILKSMNLSADLFIICFIRTVLTSFAVIILFLRVNLA